MNAALLGALLAAAPASEVALRWEAVEACPTAIEVRARVEALVGRPLEGPPRVRAEVVVKARGAGYEADLTLTTRTGTSARRLEAEACDAVVDAVAVIVALALDDADAPIERRVFVGPAPEPLEPPAPTPFGATAGIEIGWEASLLPSSAPSLRVRAGAAWWRLSLEGGLALRRSSRAAVDGAGADIGVTAGFASLCYGHPWLVGDVVGCAGMEIGRATVAPFGTTDDEIQRVLWAAVFGELAPRIQLYGPLWASLRLRLIRTVRRLTVVVDGDVEVFRPGPVGVFGGIGLEARFL